MESARPHTRPTLHSASPPPVWVPWLQLGLSTMLVVLFFVILGKAREQSVQLRELAERVQGLENSRSLDRTGAIEQQLRSAMQRLQSLERENSRLQAASLERDELERRLLELRVTARRGGPEGASAGAAPAAPQAAPGATGPQVRRQSSLPGGLQRLPQQPTAPVLRPPTDGEY